MLRRTETVAHDASQMVRAFSQHAEAEADCDIEPPPVEHSNLEPEREISSDSLQYDETNRQYSLFQYRRRIRELCKNISDITYCATEEEACRKVSASLAELNDQFAASAQDGDGILRRLSSDLRYKTVKRLSDVNRFRGKRVTALPKKRKTQKRSMGDLLGILEMNRKIRKVGATRDRQRDADDGGRTLDALDMADTCYVSEETRRSLAERVANILESEAMSTEVEEVSGCDGSVYLPDYVIADLDKCKLCQLY